MTNSTNALMGLDFFCSVTLFHHCVWSRYLLCNAGECRPLPSISVLPALSPWSHAISKRQELVAAVCQKDISSRVYFVCFFFFFRILEVMEINKLTVSVLSLPLNERQTLIKYSQQFYPICMLWCLIALVHRLQSLPHWGH